MNDTQQDAYKNHQNSRSNTNYGRELFNRLQQIFGPLAFGVILDLTDLLTFHHIGLFAGFILGFSIAWWVASIEGLTPRARWLAAVLAGIYCMTPFTETLPLATIVAIISAVAHFCQSVFQNHTQASSGSSLQTLNKC